jgi:hypothetical protein
MHEHVQIGASKRIEKLDNAFLNVQQMFIQLVVYISLYILVYRFTRSF